MSFCNLSLFLLLLLELVVFLPFKFVMFRNLSCSVKLV